MNLYNALVTVSFLFYQLLVVITIITLVVITIIILVVITIITLVVITIITLVVITIITLVVITIITLVVITIITLVVITIITHVNIFNIRNIKVKFEVIVNRDDFFFNYFLLISVIFLWKLFSKSFWTRSEQVINDGQNILKGGCRWLQLFSIDFSYFIF